jgi:hypothetical protein
MDKMKLIAIFLIPALLTVSPSSFAGKKSLDEDFYLDLSFQAANRSFTNIEVGPCRWSVDGRQFDNSLVRIRNLVLQDDALPTEERGYRVALRCQDATANVFDVQLGFGKGISASQILESQEAFQGIIEDTTVFLAFRYNVGSKR